MRLLHKRVYPQDCSFLVTIPVTREEFFSDLGDERKDFVRNLRLRFRRSDEETWALFEPAATHVAELMDFLRKQGVNVVSRARLNDLVAAQQAGHVIVLFAHWRTGELRADDIRWDQIGNTSVLPSLNPIRPLLEAAAMAVDKKSSTGKLNEVLRTQALCMHAWFGEGPNQKQATEEHRVYLNRKVLDEQFPGIFGPSASIELADGLASLDAVANCFTDRFQEILDLSVCNSILLGELVKMRSPRCLVVATRLPASVIYRAVFYRSLFKALHRGRPYIPTMEKLRAKIKDFWRAEK